MKVAYRKPWAMSPFLQWSVPGKLLRDLDQKDVVMPDAVFPALTEAGSFHFFIVTAGREKGKRIGTVIRSMIVIKNNHE